MTTNPRTIRRCDVVRITAGSLTGARAVVLRYWMGEKSAAEVQVIDEQITATIAIVDLELVTPASERCRRLIQESAG